MKFRIYSTWFFFAFSAWCKELSIFITEDHFVNVVCWKYFNFAIVNTETYFPEILVSMCLIFVNLLTSFLGHILIRHSFAPVTSETYLWQFPNVVMVTLPFNKRTHPQNNTAKVKVLMYQQSLKTKDVNLSLACLSEIVCWNVS